MANENGTWIMYGVDWDDPECIHTVEEAIAYINQVGFLPLFKNAIPGFSLEERTVASCWWCDDPKVDPWIWREIIARSGKVAYGKFFDKKAGFISVEWLPVFANYRRDGYDFDALYEDGKAPLKHKKIMTNFMEEKQDSEILSCQLKKLAGFGKDGEKGFDGAITSLMMQLYLCNSDFRKRPTKKELERTLSASEALPSHPHTTAASPSNPCQAAWDEPRSGWRVAAYCAPEHLWGYDVVTADYKVDPKDSWQKIVAHMHEIYPIATDQQIRKVLK